MTLQEFFDRSVGGVIRQGQQSVINGHCKYRGPNGLKCAVGHCISDDEYNPCWDSGGGASPRGIAEVLGWDHQLVGLAEALQMAHDGLYEVDFVKGFYQEAKKVASFYYLKVKTLKEYQNGN